MRRFDATSLDCPLLGPHLLEASAGTGKTFSMEHVFVRLLLQSIELEQILAVTFTRAAARELKSRIRANLDRAIAFLERPTDSGWEYLKPQIHSQEALSRLCIARGVFDRCQIFTIHGFCYRMLKEFAFEAHLGFSISDPEKEREISQRTKRSMRKFLEEVEELSPEQMAVLLKKYDSIEELGRAILKGKRGKSVLFSEMQRRFAAAIQGRKEERLWEEFQRVEKDYKAKKGNFQRQVQALEQALLDPEDPQPFRELLWERGSLFSFLDPSNRKVRAKGELPPFFVWACATLGPIVLQAIDPDALLETLVFLWEKKEEPLWNPDEILRQMRQAIDRESFAEKVKNRYAAVIVDEFQDTDPLQWEIFQRLFLNESQLRALYLVGDPKQSIYRFRKADVYTYFEARDFLGEGALYSLEVNFRSSKPLIGTLNALFNRNLFHLPKKGSYISYRPVEAGAEIESVLGDEKGAVHAVFSEGGFEQELLPYAVKEIETLFPKIGNFGSFALLVKDRYQAEAALQAFRERGIPAFAKSHIPLGETEAFQALRELFEAVIFSNDPVLWRIVEAGPFGNTPLPDRSALLEGLVPFFRHLSGIDSSDFKQIVEELLAWEQREGFSLEGVLRCLDDMANREVEEGGRRRLDAEERAVQILTMHISKGLEFEIVFAFGLATSQPEADEEIEAEKFRQLYVAMTRAKRRLYIPLTRGENRSPIDLFCRDLPPSYFQNLSQAESFTLEEIDKPISFGPVTQQCERLPPFEKAKPIPYSPSFLYSFTALAAPEKETLIKQESGAFTIHSLPRGMETGIVIHQIFEKIFSTRAWQREQEREALIAEELRDSPLQPWQPVIAQMVRDVLERPLLEGFALKDLKFEEVQAEMEFLFASTPHFVKGFIDLVFCREEKYYLLDWKTNWLGDSEEKYHAAALKEAMEKHDYEFQAALYREAFQRHLARFNKTFGGAFYVFVRGNAFHFFQPDLELVHARLR